MRAFSMKGDKATAWRKQAGLLLIGVLFAGALAFLPGGVQAATDGWLPHLWGGSVFPGFWVTGEVSKVADGSLTVQLPNHHHSHGMMRFISLQVTLDVDDSSILLDEELEPLELSSLAEGDDVVVVPGMVWGNLVARFLYAGDPEELADSTYAGKLVADNGDTLTLRNGRIGEFTVQVTDETLWYDNGRMDRPAELPEEITLRVLGVATEDESDASDEETEGESESGADEETANHEDSEEGEVIRAILITPAR